MKVGHTPLIQVPEISEHYGLPNLYIKDESVNPSGTWKDRKAVLAIKAAKLKNIDHICLISRGNAAYSIGLIAQNTALRITAIIDPNTDQKIRDALQSKGVRLIEVDLDKSKLLPHDVENIARCTSGDRPLDVTNFFHDAYLSLGLEIVDQIQPDWVICPVGSGEAMLGLRKAINRCVDKKTIPPVKIIGVTPKSSVSLADKLDGYQFSPYRHILASSKSARRSITTISELEIFNTYNFISRHLQVEPSSVIAFSALEKLKIPSEHTIVVVNSGRGIF